MRRPLEGIRIISIEQFGAAPYGTMFLRDLGAEVIRIENPVTGVDPARNSDTHRLGASDSQYFQTWNSNKLSVVLDMKSTEGREAFDGLVRSADAVVNNLRGDQPSKLRIAYRDLAELNPAIVCLHISAYGRDNGRATREYSAFSLSHWCLHWLGLEPNGSANFLSARLSLRNVHPNHKGNFVWIYPKLKLRPFVPGSLVSLRS